jgi:hypothetical protein
VLGQIAWADLIIADRAARHTCQSEQHLEGPTVDPSVPPISVASRCETSRACGLSFQLLINGIFVNWKSAQKPVDDKTTYRELTNSLRLSMGGMIQYRNPTVTVTSRVLIF